MKSPVSSISKRKRGKRNKRARIRLLIWGQEGLGADLNSIFPPSCGTSGTNIL